MNLSLSYLCYLLFAPFVTATNDFDDLMITEFAFPVDVPNAAYIELFTETGKGQIVARDLKIQVAYNDGCDDKVIPLQGDKIGDDGFIIFCAIKSAFESAFSDKICDYEFSEVDKEPSIVFVTVSSSTFSSE